jgi:hypothetical protein
VYVCKLEFTPVGENSFVSKPNLAAFLFSAKAILLLYVADKKQKSLPDFSGKGFY